jgi:peptide/nickel transport system permease protein
MDPDALRRLLPWGLAALGLVVLICLFVFVSTVVGLVVLGLSVATGVVMFAGWRRLILIGVVIVLVTFFTGALIRFLPGDPTEAILPAATPEERQKVRDDLGLNDSLFVQYGVFIKAFVTGETHYYQGGAEGSGVRAEKVWDRLGDRLPRSLQLMAYAQILALLFAIPFGILAAYRSGTRLDKSLSTTAFALLSLPNFVLAYILIYYLGVKNDFFPTSGYKPMGKVDLFHPLGDNFSEHFKAMFLPTVSLAVAQIAIYMRLLRSDMIQTLQEDFITMARSKGLTTRRILLRHALRPSSFSLLTVAAINLGALIGGAVIIEVIFQLGGVGTLIINAINQRQYEALQTFIGVIAVAYVLVNVVVDVLYSILDPRIRHARATA